MSNCNASDSRVVYEDIFLPQNSIIIYFHSITKLDFYVLNLFFCLRFESCPQILEISGATQAVHKVTSSSLVFTTQLIYQLLLVIINTVHTKSCKVASDHQAILNPTNVSKFYKMPS